MSPLELVSFKISQAPLTQFTLTFSESTGAASTSEYTCHLSKVFLGDEFWDGSKPVFDDYFWFNRGSYCWPIHATRLESVSFTISETGVAQFSLIVSKSTGAGRPEESTRHLSKVFRWWVLRRQRTSFQWLFVIQQGQLLLTNPRVTFGIGFVHDFEDGSGSVFINSF